MKSISLTRGYVAVVDDSDYALVSQFKWMAEPHGRTVYAVRSARVSECPDRTKRPRIRLHRVLLGVESGVEVDHRDGDGLNNRRCNLRVCAHAQNGKSRVKDSDNGSGFKGVYYHNRDDRWAASIKVNYQTVWLGYFPSSEEAAHAYDVAAVKYFGEFARLNFPRIAA